MMVDGIGVDVPLRDALREKLQARADALKTRMKTLSGNPDFNPARNSDIRTALFTTFKSPVLFQTPTGMASTASTTLEALRSANTPAGIFASLLLQHRSVTKARSTYIDALPIYKTKKGPRVRVTWKVYGTPNGRWSSRLQSVPRLLYAQKCFACGEHQVLQGKCYDCLTEQPEGYKGDKQLLLEASIRTFYTARPGHTLCYFDLSQAEARMAAYLSGDPAFILAVQGDVHIANACNVFEDEAERIRDDPKGFGKPFRDISKNFGYGINYLAGAEMLWNFMKGAGFKVTLRQVEKMLRKLHAKYRVYFRYQDSNIAWCAKHGYLISPIVRRVRWMGFHCKPNEIAAMPISSSIADWMNKCLLEIGPKLHPSVCLVGQHHDALLLEVPDNHVADDTDQIVKNYWAKPMTIEKSFVCPQGAVVSMPIDQKRGRRWSDFA
jgi:DNA polymerase-1